MHGLELDIDPLTQAALEELYRKRWLLESLKAQAEQDRLEREYREAKAVHGIGELKRRVHAFAYHDWAKKLGSYQCWSDSGFTKYFDRIAPETKVKCVGAKPGNGAALQVGWMPERNIKFSKTYPTAEAA
jgi:hypothetical protein